MTPLRRGRFDQAAMLASVLGMACAFALVFVPTVNADTEVGGLPVVTVTGDDARQELYVWDSDRDVTLKDAPIATQPELPIDETRRTGEDLVTLAESWYGLLQDPYDQEGTQSIDDLIAYVGVVIRFPSIPNALKPYLEELSSIAEELKQIRAQSADILADAQKLKIDIETIRAQSTADMRLQLTRLEKAFDELHNTLAAKQFNEILTESKLLDKARRIRDMARNYMDPKVGEDVDTKVRYVLNKTARSRRGAATLTAMKIAGLAAIIAQGIIFVESLRSQKRAIFKDTTGRPLNATWPCRQGVRFEDGTRDPGAVSCPVYDIAGSTLLSVDLRGGRDDLVLNLTRENNPFDDIRVNMGAGDDIAEGSFLGETFYGGPGNDTILGRGGDDRIYGDRDLEIGPFDPTEANDHLFGETGSDIVEGQEGNDLVDGGSGDDSSVFAALFSGVGSYVDGGPGMDTVVGGKGRDVMFGGSGRDTIFAKESDFGQPDEIDELIDCGSRPDSQEQHVTTSPPEITGEGRYEWPTNCQSEPKRIPTLTELITLDQSHWDWFR